MIDSRVSIGAAVIPPTLPFIEIDIFNPQTKKSIHSKAIVDTGSNITSIPSNIINYLNLKTQNIIKISTVTGVMNVKQYIARIQIDKNFFSQKIFTIPRLSFPLIGWDILSQKPQIIFSKIFTQIIHVLEVIPSLKKTTVLILGQHTTEIHRLYAIKERLKYHGYNGIIVKDIEDIEVQSVEDKVNMLASLCGFVICDNTVPSGHIDELKICAQNNFVTTILQEKNHGATWIQADYPFKYHYMKTFTYLDETHIYLTVDNALKWAKRMINERQKYYKGLYGWRH